MSEGQIFKAATFALSQIRKGVSKQQFVDSAKLTERETGKPYSKNVLRAGYRKAKQEIKDQS